MLDINVAGKMQNIVEEKEQAGWSEANKRLIKKASAPLDINWHPVLK